MNATALTRFNSFKGRIQIAVSNGTRISNVRFINSVYRLLFIIYLPAVRQGFRLITSNLKLQTPTSTNTGTQSPAPQFLQKNRSHSSALYRIVLLLSSQKLPLLYWRSHSSGHPRYFCLSTPPACQQD